MPGVCRHILSGLMAAVSLLTVYGQTTLPDGFQRQLIAEGLNPTAMVQAPDGRIFIAQKDGIVLLVRDDVLLPDPFLAVQVDNNNERGLGGIALHPQFEQTNLVYVFYTVPGRNVNRLSRFTANGDLAIPGSEEILFETDEMRASIHNGGAMVFGHDGKLYLSTGEGSEPSHAENLNSVLGKILRLNDDGTIPQDNPYFDELTGNRRAIWSYGLRNAFSMGFDPVSGAIFANDVGGGEWEEVNLVERGAFYGWDRLEGKSTGQSLPANYRDPVYAYDHATGCAIVGASVYAPEIVRFPPEYHGKYFFADYCSGRLAVLDLETFELQETFLSGGQRIVSLVTSRDGAMYFLERRGLSDGSPQDNTGTVDGMLWKITYSGSGAPFIAMHPESRLVPEGESVAFATDASGSQPLRYQWYLEGELVQDGSETNLQLSNVELADSGSVIQCRVSNDAGSVWSDTAYLNVTSNRRPEITFIAPHFSQVYRAGDNIAFEALVTDPEDGQLPDTQVTWWVDFHHGEHTHPAVGFQSGPPVGSFHIPQVGEIDTDVWYRIYVNARDAMGLEQTGSFDVFPQMTVFTMESEPLGLHLNVDGKLRETPFQVFSVVGIQHTLAAPVNQVQGERIYLFEGWDNGATDGTRLIHPGETEDTYIASYTSRVIGDGSGLSAAYYNSVDFAGSPVIERIDTAINFNFFFDAPSPEMNEDQFSIRWTGFLLPYETGNHHFIGIANDGIRLWVDDERVLDLWEPTATARMVGGSKWLEKGRLYPVTIEYFEESWGANVQLWWSGDVFEQEIIPKSQLFPADFIATTFEFELSIAPNPVSGPDLNFRATTLREGTLEFRIYHASGQEVFHGSQFLEFGENLINVPVDQMPAGVYFLEAFYNADDHSVTRRFVIKG